MKKILKIIVLIPFLKLRLGFYRVYHFVIFKIMNIHYEEMPKIYGRLIINNNGICSFGKGLTFRSDLTSNLVGLYKPCSIAVLKTGILEISDFTGFSGISIYCSNKIKIGRYCNFGGNVSIWDTDFHPLDFQERRETFETTKTSPILIGDDVFVGANCIILKGVSIGDRSIIGAGSIVTKNIPSDEIWAGNPAKLIRKIRSNVPDIQVL
jgi:acetyltransferase-like isoleucine patch superfamily enzyme